MYVRASVIEYSAEKTVFLEIAKLEVVTKFTPNDGIKRYALRLVRVGRAV